MPGELYGATVLRMANIDGLPVHRLLGIGAGAFRDVAKVRDHGEAVDRFAKLVDAGASLSRRLRREGRLWGITSAIALLASTLFTCAYVRRSVGEPRSGSVPIAIGGSRSLGTPTWRIEHQLPLTKRAFGTAAL